MPINYKDYPDNWKLLVHKAKEKYHNCCALCFLSNGSYVVRDEIGKPKMQTIYKSTAEDWAMAGAKVTKIVLTVHHKDGDIKNNKDTNLLPLCQRCHLILDIGKHIKNRSKKNG